MSLEAEIEPVVAPSQHLTRITPATFNGVDCAVLAERYVVYRRNSGLDVVREDPDLIKLAPPASSENV